MTKETTSQEHKGGDHMWQAYLMQVKKNESMF